MLASKRNLRTTVNQGKQGRDAIYISEHLAPYNKLIFNKCLSVKVKKDVVDENRIYKYVWTKKGTTYLRLDDISNVLRVDNVETLQNIGSIVSEKVLHDVGYFY